jgi:hypothetical protein
MKKLAWNGSSSKAADDGGPSWGAHGTERKCGDPERARHGPPLQSAAARILDARSPCGPRYIAGADKGRGREDTRRLHLNVAGYSGAASPRLRDMRKWFATLPSELL